ncbi:MAG TPA: CHAT domain-containing protein [Pyrinomonadaceae bacterium]|nr:CHAT domain-containing protein [Pyrinomonadaceae bacterium]
MRAETDSNAVSRLIVATLWSIPVLALLLFLSSWASVVGAAQSPRKIAPKPQLTSPHDQAIKLTREADLFWSEWKGESLRKALSKYMEAQIYWRRANEPHREAEVLRKSGDVQLVLSRYDLAVDYYKRALDISKSLSDQRLEIDLSNRVSKAYLEIANVTKAAPYCHRAQELGVRLGYERGLAEALTNLGVINSISGDVLEAQANFNQALTLWETVDYPEGRAATLLSLGYLQGNLGNRQTSIDYYEQALEISVSINDRHTQARSLTAMGGAYTTGGEKQKALNVHNQALKLFRTTGNRSGEAATLNGIGYVYDTLGDRKRALRHYMDALQGYRAVNNRNYAAITLGYIGRVYSASGDYAHALQFYQEKLVSSRTLQDRRMEAYTLKDLGDVVNSLGQKNKALEYYQQALQLSRSVMDRRGEALVLESIGSSYEESGQRSLALSYYEKSLALIRAVTDRRGEISTLYCIARTHRMLGNLVEARAHIEKSISLIESLRTNVVTPSLRISYLDTVYQHYEFYVDLLMTMNRTDPAAGYNGLALEVNEHARARTLLENLSAARLDTSKGVDRELSKQETELQQQLNQKTEQQIRLLSNKGSSQQAAAIRDEIDILSAQIEEVKAIVRKTSPWHAALTQPRQFHLQELQNVLGPDALLIEYSLGKNRSYLWAVTHTSLNSFELPPRSQIEAVALELYELLSAAGERKKNETSKEHERRVMQAAARFPSVAARLSNMLLGPVAPLLQGKRLVIVPDGILHYIPFNALSEPGTRKRDGVSAPLVVGHEIVTLPSLSTLAVMRQEFGRGEHAPEGIAIFADPVFEKDDPRLWWRRNNSKPRRAESIGERRFRGPMMLTPDDPVNDEEPSSFQRLPFTLLEVEEIAKVIPELQIKRAIGFDANVQAVMDPELRRYRILHFATHGLLNNSYPELSGIVLSLVDKDGRPQDGFLRLNEIYNLDLRAQLVVLSACRTGLGKEARGEGLIGLTRGFMHAGVPRVVASLWRIDDRAAAEFMGAFYEAMFTKNLAPAAALRHAQIKTWQSSKSRFPQHWAAFILQGEWN